MSNYFVLVHDRDRSQAVTAWLGKHAGDSDVVRYDLPRRRTLVLVSRHAAASTRPGTFYRGTLVAPDRDAMIFDVDGWHSAPRPVRDAPGEHAGEYVVATWDRRHLRIDRDVFGSARLMHTTGPGFAAASDSLLVLASLRRALSEPLHQNGEVLLARTALNAIAGQQISPETLFREIHYVPAGRGLRLHRMEWRLTGRTMGERVDAAGLDYAQTIRSGARDLARTVGTLADVEGWDAILSLSGGYDSRLVFAAIIATGNAHRYRHLTAYHGPKSARDFEVANALARTYGVEPVADDAGRSVAHTADELTHWAASLGGVYDGYGPIRTGRRPRRTFRLTGIGAEIHKGGWGWNTLDASASRAAPDGAVRDALVAQLLMSAPSVGADPELRNFSEIYYLGYRNGIHGAAGHISNHMTGVHPVMQMQLARLGHMTADGRPATPQSTYRGSPVGIADQSILLAPDVASFEYEDPARNITAAYAADRQRELGGPLEPLEPFTIYGHPDRTIDGPSELSLSIARQIGMVGQITAREILDRAGSALELLDDSDVRSAYTDLLANAEWRIEKTGGNLRSTGISPPRLTMLELLRV